MLPARRRDLGPASVVTAVLFDQCEWIDICRVLHGDYFEPSRGYQASEFMKK